MQCVVVQGLERKWVCEGYLDSLVVNFQGRMVVAVDRKSMGRCLIDSRHRSLYQTGLATVHRPYKCYAIEAVVLRE